MTYLEIILQLLGRARLPERPRPVQRLVERLVEEAKALMRHAIRVPQRAIRGHQRRSQRRNQRQSRTDSESKAEGGAPTGGLCPSVSRSSWRCTSSSLSCSSVWRASAAHWGEDAAECS